MLRKRSQANPGSRTSNGTMIEGRSPSSARTKAAKERVPGRAVIDPHLDLVRDLVTKAIATPVIAKVAEDVEGFKVAAVPEATSEVVGEAAADEVERAINPVETRTQRQHQLPKIRSRQRRLQLQLPPAVRLDLSLLEAFPSGGYGAQMDRDQHQRRDKSIIWERGPEVSQLLNLRLLELDSCQAGGGG